MKKVVERLNRVLAIVLAIAMVATCIPQTALTVYASETGTEESTESTTENEQKDAPGEEPAPAPPEEKVETPAEDSGDNDAPPEEPSKTEETSKIEESSSASESSKPEETSSTSESSKPEESSSASEPAKTETPVNTEEETTTETDEPETGDDATFQNDKITNYGNVAVDPKDNNQHIVISKLTSDGQIDLNGDTLAENTTYFTVTPAAGYKFASTPAISKVTDETSGATQLLVALTKAKTKNGLDIYSTTEAIKVTATTEPIIGSPVTFIVPKGLTITAVTPAAGGTGIGVSGDTVTLPVGATECKFKLALDNTKYVLPTGVTETAIAYSMVNGQNTKTGTFSAASSAENTLELTEITGDVTITTKPLYKLGFKTGDSSSSADYAGKAADFYEVYAVTESSGTYSLAAPKTAMTGTYLPVSTEAANIYFFVVPVITPEEYVIDTVVHDSSTTALTAEGGAAETIEEKTGNVYKLAQSALSNGTKLTVTVKVSKKTAASEPAASKIQAADGADGYKVVEITSANKGGVLTATTGILTTRTYFYVKIADSKKDAYKISNALNAVTYATTGGTAKSGSAKLESSLTLKDTVGVGSVYSIDNVAAAVTKVAVTARLVQKYFNVTEEITKESGANIAEIKYQSGMTGSDGKGTGKTADTAGDGKASAAVTFKVEVKTDKQAANHIESVKYQVGSGTGYPLTATNEVYTIPQTNITGDFKIIVETKPSVKATFSGDNGGDSTYEDTGDSKSKYTVYEVAKNGNTYTRTDNKMTKAAGLILNKGDESYFTVIPDTGYAVGEVKITDAVPEVVTNLSSRVYKLTGTDTNVAGPIAIKVTLAQTLTKSGVKIILPAGMTLTAAEGMPVGSFTKDSKKNEWTVKTGIAKCEFVLDAVDETNEISAVEYAVSTTPGTKNEITAGEGGRYSIPISALSTGNISIEATLTKTKAKVSFKDYKGKASGYTVHEVKLNESTYTKEENPITGTYFTTGKSAAAYFVVLPEAGYSIDKATIPGATAGVAATELEKIKTGTGVDSIVTSENGGVIFTVPAANTANDLTITVITNTQHTITFKDAAGTKEGSYAVYPVTVSGTDTKTYAVNGSDAYTVGTAKAYDKGSSDLSFAIVPIKMYRQGGAPRASYADGTYVELDYTNETSGGNKVTKPVSVTGITGTVIVYSIPNAKLTDDIVVKVETIVDTAEANQLVLNKDGDETPNYRVSLDEDTYASKGDRTNTGDVFYIPAIPESGEITVTVTPEAGYQVESVTEAGEGKSPKTLTEAAVDGSRSFDTETAEFVGDADAKKIATYKVKVIKKQVGVTNKSVTFKNLANPENASAATGSPAKMVYAVTTDATKVKLATTQPTSGEKYDLDTTATEVTFKVTVTDKDAKVPRVAICNGTTEIEESVIENPTPSNAEYTYTIPATLLVDKVVTVDEVAEKEKKTLKVRLNGDEDGHDDIELTATIKDTAIPVQGVTTRYGDMTETVYTVDANEEVTVKAKAGDDSDYKLGKYWYGPLKKEQYTVEGQTYYSYVQDRADGYSTNFSWKNLPTTVTVDLKLDKDRYVSIDVEDPRVDVVLDEDGGGKNVDYVDQNGWQKYEVDYDKTYTAYTTFTVKNTAKVKLSNAKLTNSSKLSSTVTIKDNKAIVTIDKADAGKGIVLELYDDNTYGGKYPYTYIVFFVKNSITSATVASVSKGTLTQTVDSEKPYLITLKGSAYAGYVLETGVQPAEQSGGAQAWTNPLITWTGVNDTDKDKAGLSVTVERNPRDGKYYLKVTVAGTAKGDPDITTLNNILKNATIQLKDTDGAAVSDPFIVQVSAPVLNKPKTAKMISADDTSFTLQLATDGKEVEPKTGSLWYKVTVVPTTPAADILPGFITGETSYYVAAGSDTATISVVASGQTVAEGSGKECKFDVYVRLVQSTADKTTSALGTTPANAGAYVAGFNNTGTTTDKFTKLSVATKDPYYATKITLKKGKTSNATLFTGQTGSEKETEEVGSQTGAEIAIVDFGAKTSYMGATHITVTDETQGLTNDQKLTVFAKDVADVDGNCKIYASTVKAGSNNSGYNTVKLGKHTIQVKYKVAATTMVPITATMTVNVVRGIEKLEITPDSETVFVNTAKPANVTLKVSAKLNDGLTDKDKKPSKTTLKYELIQEEVTSPANVSNTPTKYEAYRQSQWDNKGKPLVGINEKTGQVTIGKGYNPNRAGANNTFIIKATAKDYNGNTIEDQTNKITITGDTVNLESGRAVIVKKTDESYTIVRAAEVKNNKSIVTVRNWTSANLDGAYVKVLKKDAPTREPIGGYDAKYFFDIDEDALTFTSSNKAALSVDTNGQLEVKAAKATKNITITVKTAFGGSTAKIDKMAIDNAKPTELGLLVTPGGIENLYDNYGEANATRKEIDDLTVVPLNGKVTGGGLNFTQGMTFSGTADTKLTLSVVRKTGDEWDYLDEITGLKMGITGATILRKADEYGQNCEIIADKETATVKLEYTTTKVDGGVTKDDPKKKEIAITNSDYKAAQSYSLAVDLFGAGNEKNPKLIAGDAAQTVKVKVTVTGAGYEKDKNFAVMVASDTKDMTSNNKDGRYTNWNTALFGSGKTGKIYTMPEMIGGRDTKNAKTTDEFTIDIPASSGLLKGNYKLQFTCGSFGTDGSFVPATKIANKTITVIAAPTRKVSYKPASSAKISMLDMNGVNLKGTIGAGCASETYGGSNGTTLMNANVEGQTNYFNEFFSLSNDANHTLSLKTTGWDAKALAAIGAANSLTDVLEKLSSGSKAAKAQLIGYVEYSATAKTAEGYAAIPSGITKITVTLDAKNAGGKYSVTSPTIKKGTTEATVDVMLGGVATGASSIADAYVTEVKGVANSAIKVKTGGITGNKITLDSIPGNDAKNYVLTLYVVPTNNPYATMIDTAKKAWTTPANENQKKAYTDLLEKHAVKLTPTVKVVDTSATDNTTGKIIVAKSDLTKEFKAADYKATGTDAGKYVVTVPYKTLGTYAVNSLTAKANSQDVSSLISFADDSTNKNIKIALVKSALDTAETRKKFKADYGKNLSVKVTVSFGDKVKTEDLTFTLKMPLRTLTKVELATKAMEYGVKKADAADSDMEKLAKAKAEALAKAKASKLGADMEKTIELYYNLKLNPIELSIADTETAAGGNATAIQDLRLKLYKENASYGGVNLTTAVGWVQDRASVSVELKQPIATAASTDFTDNTIVQLPTVLTDGYVKYTIAIDGGGQPQSNAVIERKISKRPLLPADLVANNNGSSILAAALEQALTSKQVTLATKDTVAEEVRTSLNTDLTTYGTAQKVSTSHLKVTVTAENAESNKVKFTVTVSDLRYGATEKTAEKSVDVSSSGSSTGGSTGG